MITTVILEDDINVGNELKQMIESNHPDIKVAAVCCTLTEAEEAIQRFQPHLVFMDIELGKTQTSFDLLKKISPITFEVIFITSYNRYAIQAIKLSAIDFLL